jgi:hypothetical protein
MENFVIEEFKLDLIPFEITLILFDASLQFMVLPLQILVLLGGSEEALLMILGQSFQLLPLHVLLVDLLNICLEIGEHLRECFPQLVKILLLSEDLIIFGWAKHEL